MKPGEETLGEASQMLRDILHNKEKQQQQQLKEKAGGCKGEGNNNTLKSVNNFHSASSLSPSSPRQPPLGSSFCTTSDSEMMNSMLRGKSSSSKANSEDNDGHSVNNLSGDDSDVDSTYGAGTQSGDDAPTASHSPPPSQDKENGVINGDEEDEEVESGDVTASLNGDDSVGLNVVAVSPDSKEAKRARVENILTTIRQSPLQGSGFETMLGQTTPMEMKRQKRKQPQPQQHDVRSLLAPESKYRKVERIVMQEHIRQLQQQLYAVRRSYNQITAESDDEDDFSKDDMEIVGRDVLENEVRDSPDNFLRVSTRDKDSVSPAANGHSPRGGSHTVRDEASVLATSAPFRLNGKTVGEGGPNDFTARMKAREGLMGPVNGTCFPMFPFPPPNVGIAGVGFQRVALTLKSEILQAVTKAVDSAVSTVLEKHAGSMNSEPQPEPIKTELPSQEQRHQQQHQQQQQQQQHQEKHQRDREHQQHQQQHHHQPQQSLQLPKQPESFHRPMSAPRPQKPEREALKETVSNSQNSEHRVPELVVPFSDHLNFLERFSSSRLPEKISAFEPLPPHPHHGPHRGHGLESDLIRPHTSTALTFPPHFPYSYMQAGLLPPVFPPEPEQTEAMSLVVNHNAPKKKRTKVTDTRLSPRAKSALLSDSPLHLSGLLGPDMSPCSLPSDITGRHPGLPSPFPHPYLPPVLPTSVAIANPSLHRSDLFNFRFHDSIFSDSHMGNSPPVHDRSSPQSPLMDNSSQSLLRSSADFDSNPDSMDGQNSQKISFFE